MSFRLTALALLSFCASAQPPTQAPAKVGPAAPSVQTPQPPAEHKEIPKSDIKVSVNEVIVPITVTDEKGKFVSDLDQADFRIFDGGKEQKIEFFTRERNQPVVVGFLIDLSNASRIHWKNYESAAEEMVQIGRASCRERE